MFSTPLFIQLLIFSNIEIILSNIDIALVQGANMANKVVIAYHRVSMFGMLKMPKYKNDTVVSTPIYM